jgi:hypothetical protein
MLLVRKLKAHVFTNCVASKKLRLCFSNIDDSVVVV